MTTTFKPGLRSAMNTWLASLPAPQAAPLRANPIARTAERLTPREIDVLHLLACDCTYAEAAARLGISPHTVVTHIKNAYRKLDVHSAAAAVMRVVQLGLLCIDAPHKPDAPSPAAHALADLSDR